ncbi:ribbon-helix-helix protein, CopG family [Geobacter sp. SVR]|uniref:ribbon-helix-helix protein, CopG family n=1 Tax=Geobacter sp. SVR TaxID=2495594 RepID=UPI00143F0576|nr:ribbon-helix-helix protein, CopG family [Geobacter sp. SVR]GCF87705.1 hypothetical protein GSbR_43050 [Geobacter sp. SVR]
MGKGKAARKPRSQVISMRVSEGERRTLQEIAHRQAINVSDIMRHALERYTGSTSPPGGPLKNGARA